MGAKFQEAKVNVMKSTRIFSCIALAALVALAACSKQESATSGAPAAPAKGQAGTIGISVLTLANPFFKEITDAVRDEAGKSGYAVVAVSSENDPALQRTQVKDFIVRKVSAIILTPADSKAVGTAIKEANDAGIPVFTADIASIAEGAKVVCHVATDNYAGGRQAAQAMIKALGNKGKVAIIEHPEVESAMLRTKGFKDELAEQKSPIQVVGAWPGKGMKDEAFKVAQDILTAQKELDGLFCINDPMALGAFAAVEKAGRAGKLAIIGFDGQLEGKKAIRDGKLYADPIQFPDQIGRGTVKAIMQYLNGEKVEPQMLIPTKLYYKADAEQDKTLKEQ